MDTYLTEQLIHEAANELETIQDLIRWTASQLNASHAFFGHGTDNAWDEAASLVLPALHLPVDLSSEATKTRLTSSEKNAVLNWVEQRVNHKVPVPYLTHQAWFMGMPFYVDERVLVPRSPFAELIEKQFSPWLVNPNSVTRILDMCTGSACIAIALAHSFESAEVDAIDISADALSVADININDYQLTDRVFPIQSDVFSGIAGQKYDLIVANPPYVDAEDMADLPAEFHHEPELGLASGDDGLDVTRVLLKQAADHLNEDGLLFVEVGNSMVHIEHLYPEVPFTWIEFERGGLGVFMISKADLIKHFAAA